MICKHNDRVAKAGFGWCRDCGRLMEGGRVHMPRSAGVKARISAWLRDSTEAPPPFRRRRKEYDRALADVIESKAWHE